MEEFKTVDIKEYVSILIKECTIIKAYKVRGIYARKGIPGEKVYSYTKNGVLETVNTVADDGNNYYVVNDEINKENRWIMTENYLMNNFYLVDDFKQFYFPNKNIRLFIRVNENIEFMAPWNEKMRLKNGGFLNITNIDEVVCIQEEEFNEYYKIIE